MSRTLSRQLASTALVVVLAAAAAGCKTTGSAGSTDPTRAYAMAGAPPSQAD
jgi:hypothetical protein